MKKTWILCLCMLLIMSDSVFLQPGENTVLKYKDFQIGAKKSEIKTILYKKYSSSKIVFRDALNEIEISINELGDEKVLLQFDVDTLYCIKVNLGSDRDSLFNSKLLNYLESKYGLAVPENNPGKDVYWKFIWNLSDKNYELVARYLKNEGIEVTYVYKATEEKYKMEKFEKAFSDFKKLYLPPSEQNTKSVFSFQEFRIGDPKQKITNVIANTYSKYTLVYNGSDCKCQNLNAVKILDRSVDENGAEKIKSEMLLCFDSNNLLCEISLKNYEVNRDYMSDLVMFLKKKRGAPSFISEDSMTAQWEFEKEKYFFTATYFDYLSINLLDVQLIKKCNFELEKKPFSGF